MRLAAGLSLLFCALLGAQQAPQVPHIGFVYPAGGRQGATLELTIGGQFLNNANEAYISGSGVQVAVSQYIKPLTQQQATDLREELQKLNEKRQASTKPATADATPPVFTPADEKRVTEIQEKLADFQRRPLSPAIAETVLLHVTIASDAVPGPHDLRLGGQLGITNPLPFWVGDLPEVSRKPAKLPPAFAVSNGATPPNRPSNRQAGAPMDVTLPAVINGQMMPGTFDQYRFQAAKGQHIVASVLARELVPYISDAVPGWFQAAITLRDAAGKELASADHFRFHQDPVLEYDIPADGQYALEIHDAIFRGREDFVYRITLGQLPYVTGIYPLGGRAGGRAPIRVSGWNLPDRGVVQDSKAKPGDVVQVSLAGSNQVPFAIDALPEVVVQDTATRRDKAQKLKLPVVVNGRIAHPGDWQYFRFDGKAGEEIVAEVMARRLNSPLDSVLRLTDSSGKEIAYNDDFDDKSMGLLTHQADSRILIKLPSNGTYYLQLGDTQRKGGLEYAYRLRLSAPQPDFDLRVVPSTINLRAGATLPITVYAIRHDGFAGEIGLQLKDASGFTLGGASVPNGQDKVRITLTAPRGQAGKPFKLQLEGRAMINTKDVRRLAAPAEDMMQAFAYHHLVAEKDWMVRIIGAGQAGVNVRAAAEKPVKVISGGTSAVDIVVPPRLMDGMVLLLNEPPDGITIEKAMPVANGMALTLHVDPKVLPGTRGNLIVDAYTDRIVTPQGGKATKRRNLLGTLPAIPFEVIK